ncbi:acetamidase/formamidase family protein [Amycolatopsis sp., V23-08]|uniref:Acetamidase/formamidase family protein n=1 Tax=Amycolatopsis heterodermiae TaxID=3110235 RepID=A0ABU5R522_9PSEU|nr:acetamidase/formamidase family protein [Amycolatopsis sp., V23-08]MEA5360914.1 acetamidase/formamidase family protein [Amycolatopsis sp., V23-08]
MTEHHLPATRETTVDVFDRDTPPVLTVDPGDSVVVGSLDAAGYLERRIDGPTMFTNRRGHCLTGPIEVRGAEPGAVLEVHFTSITPGGWGWTTAGVKDNALTRELGVADGPAARLTWDIGDDTATSNLGHTVGIAPFLGVTGLPPAEPGPHSTIPPRAAGGGNIDCRDLVAGSTLFLPVTVPGARLHLGDGHAAQGHGEVGGTAIECPMTTGVTLTLTTDPAVPGIHAVTPEGRVTFGFDADLNRATTDALGTMLTWLQRLHDLDRPTALALASPVVDLRVTQIANETWGVHAVLPHGAIR